MANFAEAGIKFIAQGINSFVSSIERANSAATRFNASISTVSGNANRYITRINNVSGAADDVEEKLMASRERARVVGETFTTLGDQADWLTKRVLPALAVGLSTVAVALGLVVKSGLKTAVSFENAFADVTKTVDAFVDRAETAATGIVTLTDAGKEFRESLVDLTTEIPVTFEELSAIAGLGGQLGVIEGLAGDEAKASLLAFTETVAGLGEATDLTQEKAAIGLSQISNIYRQSIDDIGLNVERLGSTIVELGNTSAATEKLILNFSQRIAGAGQTIGLSQAEVLGIGTAFASIGITAEAGATAVNRALLIMNEAVAESTDKFVDNTSSIIAIQEQLSDYNADLVRLEAQTGISGESLTAQRDAWVEAGNAVEDFGRQLGDTRRENLFQTQTEIDRLTQKLNTLRITQGTALTTEVFDELLRVVQLTAQGADQTAESFKTLFRDDPAEAFALFVEGLAQEGDQAGATLDRIGLGSVEATRAFLAMAGASDAVRDRILAATAAFEENSALTDEVSIRYATLKSNAEELWGALRALGDNVFGILIPLLNPLVEWGKEVLELFRDEIPPIITAFVSAIRPQIEGAFNELFSGGGLFAGGEIITPEGFKLSGQAIGARIADEMFPGGEIQTPEGLTISGELIGAQQLTGLEGLRDKLRDLRSEIEQMDFVGLKDSIVNFVTGAQAAWGMLIDNLDAIKAGIDAVITGLGTAFLISALKKAGEAVAFLSTPLGNLVLAAVGFSIVWENNWLNVQQVTENTIEAIKTSLSDFKTTVENLGVDLDFGGLTGGAEQELGDVTISGALIGIEPTMLQEIGAAAEIAAEGLGKLVTLIVDTPLDQVEGFLTLIGGLSTIFANLPSLIAPDPVFGISDLIVDDRLAAQARIREGLEAAVRGALETFTAPIINLAELIGIDIDLTSITKSISDKISEAITSFTSGFMSQFGGANIEGLGDSFTGLISSLSGLGEAGLVTIFVAGLKQMGEALGELGTALGSLLSNVDGQKLLSLAGSIAGFLVKVSIDELIAVINGLTGLVTILDGILRLDLETIGQGFTTLGTAMIDGLFAPLQNLGEQFEFDLRAQIIDPIPGILTDFGTTFSDYLSGAVNSSIGTITSIREAIQGIFEFQVDPAIIDAFFEGFKSKAISTALVVQFYFVSMFDGVEIVPPLFTRILEKATEIKDKIVAFFTDMFDGITIEVPDFGITEKLIELGLIDAPETETIGEDMAAGLRQGVENEEPLWQETWYGFLYYPVEFGQETLGMRSPSTVTEQMGRDLVLGYVKGLSDLTPLEEALIGVNSSILTAFSGIVTSLESNVKPALSSTDQLFINLYSDTLPRTTSAIIDELIPAKEDLTDVNNLDLIPSVESLIDAEGRLESQLMDVDDVLRRLIGTKKTAKTEAKELVKEIDLLTEAYLSLASAIEDANTAGTGIGNAPASPGPAGPEFQSGGSFIVPKGIGPEGMPIRVHAGELVQIIPQQFVDAVTSLPVHVPSSVVSMPAISGATVNNTVNNTSSSDVKEFHLHVTESPSYDVRDSFELLEALT